MSIWQKFTPIHVCGQPFLPPFLPAIPLSVRFSFTGQRTCRSKEQSDLDIALDDGTGDAAYLEALGAQLALERAKVDLAIYLAGAVPYRGDRLGRLTLSKAGLAERDRMVFNLCRKAGIPVATAMGGGYTREAQDVVDIRLQTARIAVEMA